MSDMQAAYLWAQLEAADRINQQRLALCQNYYDALEPLASAGRIDLPSVPEHCVQNAQMFYIKLRDIADRTALILSLIQLSEPPIRPPRSDAVFVLKNKRGGG
ncbi:hypothetical protein D3H66_26335, partial [Citrobacter portucalensis]